MYMYYVACMYMYIQLRLIILTKCGDTPTLPLPPPSRKIFGYVFAPLCMSLQHLNYRHV